MSWNRICYSFETPLLHFIINGSASRSELPKSLAAGRPPPTLRGGRDLAVFQGLCSDRNRTRAINYVSKCCKLTSKHDRRDFMAIFAIAALHFCLVKLKKSIFPKIYLSPDITRLNIYPRATSRLPIASTYRAQSVVFFYEALRHLARKHPGVRTNPPLHWRMWQNVEQGR